MKKDRLKKIRKRRLEGLIFSMGNSGINWEETQEYNKLVKIFYPHYKGGK